MSIVHPSNNNNNKKKKNREMTNATNLQQYTRRYRGSMLSLLGEYEAKVSSCIGADETTNVCVDWSDD
jgi:hypothetical protein